MAFGHFDLLPFRIHSSAFDILKRARKTKLKSLMSICSTRKRALLKGSLSHFTRLASNLLQSFQPSLSFIFLLVAFEAFYRIAGSSLVPLQENFRDGLQTPSLLSLYPREIARTTERAQDEMRYETI